jgi:hypothetical protein
MMSPLTFTEDLLDDFRAHRRTTDAAENNRAPRKAVSSLFSIS